MRSMFVIPMVGCLSSPWRGRCFSRYTRILSADDRPAQDRGISSGAPQCRRVMRPPVHARYRRWSLTAAVSTKPRRRWSVRPGAVNFAGCLLSARVLCADRSRLEPSRDLWHARRWRFAHAAPSAAVAHAEADPPRDDLQLPRAVFGEEARSTARGFVHPGAEADDQHLAHHGRFHRSAAAAPRDTEPTWSGRVVPTAY